VGGESEWIEIYFLNHSLIAQETPYYIVDKVSGKYHTISTR
jgi:hypothetical protein